MGRQRKGAQRSLSLLLMVLVAVLSQCRAVQARQPSSASPSSALTLKTTSSSSSEQDALSPAALAMLDTAKAAVQAHGQSQDLTTANKQDGDGQKQMSLAFRFLKKNLFGSEPVQEPVFPAAAAAPFLITDVPQPENASVVANNETATSSDKKKNKEKKKKGSSDVTKIEIQKKKKKSSSGVTKKVIGGVVGAAATAAALRQFNRRRARKVLYRKPTKAQIERNYERALSQVRSPTGLVHPPLDRFSPLSSESASSDDSVVWDASELAAIQRRRDGESASAEAHRIGIPTEEWEETLMVAWQDAFKRHVHTSLQVPLLSGLISTAGASADSAVDLWRMLEHSLIDPYKLPNHGFLSWDQKRRLLDRLRSSVNVDALKRYTNVVCDRGALSACVAADEAMQTAYTVQAMLTQLSETLFNSGAYQQAEAERKRIDEVDMLGSIAGKGKHAHHAGSRQKAPEVRRTTSGGSSSSASSTPPMAAKDASAESPSEDTAQKKDEESDSDYVHMTADTPKETLDRAKDFVRKAKKTT